MNYPKLYSILNEMNGVQVDLHCRSSLTDKQKSKEKFEQNRKEGITGPMLIGQEVQDLQQFTLEYINLVEE